MFNPDDAEIMTEYLANLANNSSPENLQNANRKLSYLIFDLSKQIKKK